MLRCFVAEICCAVVVVSYAVLILRQRPAVELLAFIKLALTILDISHRV